MSEPRSALLITGSPRGHKSTSQSLGSYVMDRLAERGWLTDTAVLAAKVGADGGLDDVADAARAANLVILAQPLYVDSLPAIVVRTLEHLAERKVGSGQALVAIVNCGFPEAEHNGLALEMCELFAREAGFHWAGGVALGMGEAISARALRDAGGMVHNVVRALDLTAAALDQGDDVPDEARALIRKPFLPAMVYLWMGNSGWKRQAGENGVANRLYARPYAD